MKQFCLILLFCGLNAVCSGGNYKDTLWTSENDRVIITYDLHYSNDRLDIRFLDVKKKLGQLHSKKYRKLEDVEIIFFDRTGVYKDMTFTNMVPEAFMVPSCMSYKNSNSGYFLLKEQPSLSFSIERGYEAIISIPLYFAHNEGRKVRKLFSVCNFCINVKSTARKNKASTDIVDEMPVVQDKNNSNGVIYDSEEVYVQINTVRTLLDAQTRLPFSDGLQYEMTYLRNMEKEVADRALLLKIKDCLTSCELKKIELEEMALAEAKKARDEADRKEWAVMEEERARQDAITAEQYAKEEADKKRNIWMIVSVVILAIVCFVGNQVLQHFSNVRNQRNIMEIQQDLARRVESEAKNYSRQKTNEFVRNTKNSTRTMVRNKVKQSQVNKSKQISI